MQFKFNGNKCAKDTRPGDGASLKESCVNLPIVLPVSNANMSAGSNMYMNNDQNLPSQ
jgi:hypothetical protein